MCLYYLIYLRYIYGFCPSLWSIQIDKNKICCLPNKNFTLLAESASVSTREPWEECSDIRTCQGNGRKKRLHTIATCIGLGSPSGIWCLPHTRHNKNREFQPECGGTVCEAGTRWDGRTRVVCCCRWSCGWPLFSDGQHLEGFWDTSIVILETWIVKYNILNCRIYKLLDCRRCSGLHCKSVHMMCLSLYFMMCGSECLLHTSCRIFVL